MFSRILSLAGTAAVLGALLSTATPIHLGAVDRAGSPIPCGNGFHPRLEVAQEQDRLNFEQHTSGGPMFVTSNYVEQCQSILSDRQSTALPVGVGGTVALIAAVVLRRYRRIPFGQQPAVAPVLPSITREGALL
ncbi:hypothetical protein MAUB_53110 [Mycolicibacterium aubagnense]|uniref:Lipoprotein LpqS n=1 Tax=Mycolicibacterium aubagnense TaxID=319707 RepID=A0ABM7IL19_9MYCO|nr:hypothetical protein MAUB_53110 [Mycolicibacterium aubagnense]